MTDVVLRQTIHRIQNIRAEVHHNGGTHWVDVFFNGSLLDTVAFFIEDGNMADRLCAAINEACPPSGEAHPDDQVSTIQRETVEDEIPF